MANVNDIELYHQHLTSTLNQEGLLGQRAIIRPAPHTDWKHAKFKGPIDFELWPINTPVMAGTDQGGELAVFALEKLRMIGPYDELIEIGGEGNSGICWISWHERWERLVPETPFPGKKGRQPHFMLATIQWILFWGRPNGDRKSQILRAEWDNSAHVAKKKQEYELAKEKRATTTENHGVSEVGQPHWHVDRVLELGEVGAYLQHRGTELQELAYASYAGQYLKLQRVHFAMAGWKNGALVAAGCQLAMNHPARWQIEYTEERDELIEWNLSTLCYIKSQAPYISAY